MTQPNPVKAWSYSRLNLYEQCPARFKYQNIDKLPQPTSPAMERGKQMHKDLEMFMLSDELPVPDAGEKFEEQLLELHDMDAFAEQQWGFNKRWCQTGWFAKDTWFRAMLDVGVLYEDRTGEAIDYKSGKKYGDNADQMLLFGAAFIRRFPQTEAVATRLWYLDSGEEEIEMVYRKELPAITLDFERRIRPMFNDTTFAPRPNDKCKWCPFSRDAGGPCEFGG